MKRLLIAVGAIAATTLAIEKMIEYAMKQDETDDMEFTSEEPCDEVAEEFICLNEVEEPEPEVEEVVEESVEAEEDAFDTFVDDAGNAVKEIGSKVRSFLNDLPKISITINVDKNEK
ncbi:MAG: hypothetical protein IKM20_08200 [Erysipelotrichales bacterium]|nr:hypothetical protein [Erysipelotrichales bacterium]